jgi:hypothetical protein
MIRLLLALELRRASDAVRHPRPGAWLSILLPVTLTVGGLWRLGAAARPDAGDGQGRILLALLAAAVPCLLAYPPLFRAADDSLLRHLGILPRWIFAVRALRLVGLTAAGVLMLMVPYASTGAPLGTPLAIASAAALVACAWSLSTHAGAAVQMANGQGSAAGAFIGFDPELKAAAPLVFAPIFPAIGAVVAGRWMGAALDAWWWRMPVVLVIASALAVLAAARFEAALPRFAARAAEMAFAPAPGVGQTGLVIDRGLPSLLPRRIGAVRARDAAVVSRRFRWAVRGVVPVAILGVLALLRAGGDGRVRAWVVGAAGVLLLAQMVAVVRLGRIERGGPAWVDRALGIRVRDRLAGRWAAGLGMSLGFTAPMAIAWWMTVPEASPWPWLGAAAASTLVGAGASTAAARA